MLRQTNSFSRRFNYQQEFCMNNMDHQYSEFPQHPINCYQMNNPEFCAYDEFGSYSKPGHCSPGFSGSGSDSGFRAGGDGKARFQEITEESEAVDELLQIMVECLKKADVKTREVLLRKCFFEIEKEIPLERFLVDRMKHTRAKLLSDSLQKMQWGDGFSDEKNTETNCVFATREVELSAGEKLERFKVKTVVIGDIVKEEARYE